MKKFRKKVEKVLDDAFNNFGSEVSERLAGIKARMTRRFDELAGVQTTQEESEESDVEMEVESDNEVSEDQEEPGSSADSATPLNSVTATGQSPPKKQKGAKSSDNQ